MKIVNKIVKGSLVAAAAALLVIGFGATSYAFHSGGVAECMGCHNIHDAASTSALLVGTDISSTCLSCHGAASAGSYHIASMDVGGTNNGLVPRQMTPGGDFGWLLKTFTWSPRSGSSSTEDGFEHGHSIVAADYGFTADGVNTTAPGGNMDATQLSCNSCHDNHGKLRRFGLITNPTWGVTGAPIIASGSYKSSPDPAAGQAVGSYRLLRGPGSTAGTGGKSFTAVFNAVAPDTYNRTETASAPTRVGYGFGVSEWCATCHPDMHTSSSSKHTHPVSQGLTIVEVNTYKSYLGSGLSNGTSAQAAISFDSIVPFQTDNTRSITALKALANSDGSNRNGPQGTTDRVMCLSCHRAHASGFAHMTRWNNDGEFIAVEGVWPGIDSPSSIASAAKYAMGRTVAETTAAYNGTTMHYASYQRSLCNKCHGKD
jgi:predicted CXXCH cytochrome family protein